MYTKVSTAPKSKNGNFILHFIETQLFLQDSFCVQYFIAKSGFLQNMLLNSFPFKK